MSNSVKKVDVAQAFEQVSAANDNNPGRKPKPFSLRLTVEERAYLEEQASHQALGAYIREVLLSGKARKRRTLRKPKADERQLVLLLSALGDSRLASNLNQLAHHANMGTLETSEALEQELHEAYLAVIEMRNTLLSALGLRESQGG